jgi:hypothetical protein
MIDSDRYLEAKLIDWLARRQPAESRDELATRAFVVIRAARGVTIHAFAEGLPEDARARVRVSVKKLVLHALGIG